MTFRTNSAHLDKDGNGRNPVFRYLQPRGTPAISVTSLSRRSKKIMDQLSLLRMMQSLLLGPCPEATWSPVHQGHTHVAKQCQPTTRGPTGTQAQTTGQHSREILNATRTEELSQLSSEIKAWIALPGWPPTETLSKLIKVSHHTTAWRMILRCWERSWKKFRRN